MQSFPTNARTFAGSRKKSEESLEKRYECPDPSCTEEFERHSDLELHLNMYGHRIVTSPIKESLYDKLKRDWVHRFKVLSLQDAKPSKC